jgi:HEAT repeat protein
MVLPLCGAQTASIAERIHRAQILNKVNPVNLTTNDWSFIRSEVARGRGSNLIHVLAQSIQTPIQGRVLDSITSLGNIGPAAAPVVPSLIKAFKGLEDPHRSYLVRAFGQIGPAASNAVPTLIKLIQTGDSARAAAVNALGEIGKPASAAIPILTELSRTADTEWLAFSCHNALARISDDPSPHFPHLLSELDRPNKRGTTYLTAIDAMKTIEALGPKAKLAIPALIKQLEFHSSEHVRAAARALGAMGPHAASAEKKLIRIIESPKQDEETRVIAAEALGQILGGFYDAKAKIEQIKLTERQKQQSEWDEITKKFLRYTSELPPVTRVEISRISRADSKNYPAPDSKTFPVGDEKHGAIVHAQTNLIGPTAFEIANSWRRLHFGYEFQAACHEPAYGLRFFSGKKLLFETSVCWGCHNFTVPGAFMGFDAESADAQRLLQQITQFIPLGEPNVRSYR